MAVLEFTIPDFSLTSNWTVAHNGSQYYYHISPTTQEVTKTVSFASIPSGSTINSANMTATVGSPNTGASIRSVNDAYFSGASLAVGATAGGSKDYVFKFKAVGHLNSTGMFSASQTFSNIKITVDYTLPHSVDINVGGSWKSGSPWVNVGGTWKKGKMWVNVGGSWKQGK